MPSPKTSSPTAPSVPAGGSSSDPTRRLSTQPSRRWGLFEPRTLLAGWAAALGMVQLLVLGLSITSVSIGTTTATLIVLAAIVAGGCLIGWFAVDETGELPSPGDAAGTAAGALALLWSAAVWVVAGCIALVRPPYDWDGLYYHIPAMHSWSVQGRVSWIDTLPDVPFVNYPMGVETFSFLVHRLSGTTRLIDAGNLAFWPLAVCGLAVLARCLGARGGWSWFAGGLIVGAPVFVGQSMTCYVDAGFSAAVIGAIAAATLLVFEPAPRTAVLCGTTTGLMLGIKGSGLPFMLLLLILVLGALLWTRRRRHWWRWVKFVAMALVIAVSIGGYWYLRNAYRTANPLHPVELRVGSTVLRPGYDIAEALAANMPPWLERWPAPLRPVVSWTQPDVPVAGYDPISGLGYIWLVGGVPALLWCWWSFLRGGRHHNLRALPFLTVVVLALLSQQPAPWWGRLTLWLHSLGLPCLAIAFGAVVTHWRQGRRRVLVMTLLVAILAVAAGESAGVLWYESRRNRVADSEALSFQPSIDFFFPGMSTAGGYNELLAADLVARGPWTSRAGPLLGGLLAMPLGKRRLMTLPGRPEEADVRELCERRVELVLWDTTLGPPPELLLRSARDTFLYHTAGWADLTLLRLACVAQKGLFSPDISSISP